MDVTVLGSSSKGNSTLVKSRDSQILVDSGLGIRHTQRNLRIAGSSVEEVDAVLITHCHSDHVRSLSKIGLGKKVIASPGTMNHLLKTEKYNGSDSTHLDYGQTVTLRDLSITSFPVPHDCPCQPSGFVLDDGEEKVGIATDLGEVTEEVARNLQGCTGLVIESNHSSEMLLKSKRPPWLISRILGPEGHLSNDECAEGLERIMDERTRWVILAHLSQECNSPAMVHKEVGPTLKKKGVGLCIADPALPKSTQDVVRYEKTV